MLQLLPFAQISPDMVHPLVQWLVGLSVTVFLANQLFSFHKDHVREKPTASDTYATKKELTEAHGRMSRERKDIEAALLVLREEDTRLRNDLKAEVDHISRQIQANTKAGEDRVMVLHDRLNALPTEIIELLRKTKGLL